MQLNLFVGWMPLYLTSKITSLTKAVPLKNLTLHMSRRRSPYKKKWCWLKIDKWKITSMKLISIPWSQYFISLDIFSIYLSLVDLKPWPRNDHPTSPRILPIVSRLATLRSARCLSIILFNSTFPFLHFLISLWYLLICSIASSLISSMMSFEICCWFVSLVSRWPLLISSLVLLGNPSVSKENLKWGEAGGSEHWSVMIPYYLY